MKDLKKYGAIGGAIAIALCWPFAVGQIGQSLVTDGLEKSHNDSVSIDLVDYDRGYLSSTVTTRWSLTDAELIEQFNADNLPTEFLVKSDVTHGLFSLSAHSVPIDMDEVPLSVESKTQLNGNTDYVLTLDSWHYSSEQDNSVAISMSPSTLQGTVTVLGEITYQLNIPSIELDFETGEKLMIDTIKGNGDGKQAFGFWLGKQAVNIGNVSVQDLQNDVIFSMENSQYTLNSAIDGEPARINSQHIVSLDKMITPDGEVSDLVVDFSLGDIDSESFEQIMMIYQNAPMLDESDVQQAIPYVESLIEKGFYLSMNDMSMKFGEGEFDSKWRLELPQGTQNVAQDPTKVLLALTGNLNTFFSNALVDEYPFIKQGVDEAIVMDMIKQTPEGYQINAEVQQGQLVFENGQKIPVMALLLPMMMQ